MSNSNNGYGDLEEQKKQQQPAAPNATPAPAAPTTRAVDGYGQFLETLANNKKIENTPTNAKTYADYLTYLGQDPVGEYNARVRQANLDYAKGLATYGQNAEKMAKSGLVGSGYGEYLTGIAYQGKQSAVGAAQRDAKAAIDKNYASYGDYIEGLKSTNEQNAINGILSGALEGDAAKEYARSQGVTEDRLDFIVSQTATSVSQAKTKKLADATSAVSALVAEGQTVDSAMASLEGVYDKDTLDKVKENLQNASNAQIEASVNSATGVANYNDALVQQKASSAITPEQYNAQVVAGQNKNYEFVQRYLDSSDTSGIAEYAKAVGLDISASTTDQVNAVVDHMASNNVISKAQQQQYYTDSWKNTISETEYTSKQAVNAAEKIHNLFASEKITSYQKTQLLSALSNRARAVFGDVVVTGQGKKTNDGSVTVKYKHGDLGDEAIEFNLNDGTKLDSGSGFIPGRSISVKVGTSSKLITFGTIAGKFTICHDGSYYQEKSGYNLYANTKDNEAFVACMMA